VASVHVNGWNTKKFLADEGKGNWKGRLSSLTEMLPYFAASCHNLYLESSYRYLQDMFQLKEQHPAVNNAFMSGSQVVRRSDKFWAGLSTNLVIEQVLTRSVKYVGAMTRGRGMTAAQRAQWLLSMPACVEINSAVQCFTN